jgi:acyl-CoA reductase-like NAD-dependent aldehyde dehydrogenase
METIATHKVDTFPMYIGGEWVTSHNPHTVTLPYDGSPVGSTYQAKLDILEKAIKAAKSGARTMAELSNFERAELLHRIAFLVKRDVADFSHLICCETGKPIKEARGEAERSIQTITLAAEEARRLNGEVIPMDGAPAGKGRMGMMIRQPLGVVGAITPFNVPLNLAMHKVAPALAAGNSVIHKPALVTPLSALRFACAVEEAGAPRGAYNVIIGEGKTIGSGLVTDPNVAMITFTGSVPIGTSIREIAGLKRVTLELGSNSALVLEPDCDLDTVVPRAVFGSFAHSGQICISVQRIYVHESIGKVFLDRFVAATEKLVVGHPFEESTDISSLINETEAIRVSEWITQAVQSGARLLTGGERKGTTVRPTILADVVSATKVSCKEVFGPVVAVNRYRHLDEAIESVNYSAYGLQAGIFTSDIKRAFYAAKRLEVGGVMINDVPTFRVDQMPYGGVKQSGMGREGPRYAIEEMTEPKLICWTT